jgi:DNA-binding CsgD family transcriptional regulator
MARLRQRELKAFSQALAALHADDAMRETFSARALHCLRSLFACEFADCSMVDLRRRRWNSLVLSPTPPDWPGREAFERHSHEQPIVAHVLRTGTPHALKTSDFLTLRQYRALGVYCEVFRQVGCGRLLGFVAQPVKPLTLGVGLHRKGRDFSEEERALLDLLRPHLLQAYAADRAAECVRAERDRERESLGSLFAAGLCEVDGTGRLLWITRRAEALLADFFPPQDRHEAIAGRLPAGLWNPLSVALRRRQEHAQNERLLKLGRRTWRFAGPGQRALTVRLAAAGSPGRWQMLLEEIGPVMAADRLMAAFRLTPRETEVLGWVRQGKTNWEIGVILGAAEKTVGKHLEHVFEKLGVENRTAAVQMAAEAIAEA